MESKHIIVAGAVGAGLYWWFTRTDKGRHLWAGLVELSKKGGHCCAECAAAATSPAPPPQAEPMDGATQAPDGFVHVDESMCRNTYGGIPDGPPFLCPSTTKPIAGFDG